MIGSDKSLFTNGNRGYSNHKAGQEAADELNKYLLVIPALLAFCFVLVLFTLFSSIRSGKKGGNSHGSPKGGRRC